MRYTNTAILTILSGIVIGIAISGYVCVPLQYVIVSSLGLLSLLSIHSFLSFKNTKFRKGFVFHTFITSLSVGFLLSSLHNPTSKSTHYTKLLTENFYYLFKGEITEKISESDFGITYKVNLISADNHSVTGVVLCFLPSSVKKKEDILQSKMPFARGQIIDFVGKCNSISPPKNPYQFDYKKYMERQGVYWRVNVVSYSAEKDLQVSSLRGFAEKIRQKMFAVLDTNFSKETASLLKTLLLGNRSELDEEVYQHYIDAGAVHILAISGLHVGIVTAILLFFLQKMPNMGIWKYLRLFLLLLFLWSFAFLAGLSPSVLRAVTMFSFVGIALILNREQGRFDALMFSMFLLLLIHPNYLYKVGFQLSYAAVFSILIFYPKLEKWWTPKNKFLKNVWSLLIIGFAAQVVVLPISLYYFHQFPTLFFVSNLLIVPLLTPILVLGFLSLFLGILDILPAFLVFILEKIVALMNFLAKMIALQEVFIFRNIYFDEILLISSLLVVLGLIYWVNKPNYRRTLALLVTVLLFQGTLFYTKYQSEIVENMTVFSVYKNSLFSVRNGNQLIVYQKDSLKSNFIITNYIRETGISDVRFEKTPYLFEYQGNTILYLDSLGIYPRTEKHKIDKVIVTQSPKINFERMLLEITPKEVIADGTNYPSFVNRWRKKCEELGILFHSTAQDGAYIFE